MPRTDKTLKGASSKAFTTQGLRFKQRRKLPKSKDPRWSPEANRKRAEFMRGKKLSLETRAGMSATRRNPGSDPTDPKWDQALWERDRQAYIDQIQNREKFLAQLAAEPARTTSQLRSYLDLFYHQLRSVFAGKEPNLTKLRTMVQHGRLDDVLAQWAVEYP